MARRCQRLNSCSPPSYLEFHGNPERDPTAEPPPPLLSLFSSSLLRRERRERGGGGENQRWPTALDNRAQPIPTDCPGEPLPEWILRKSDLRESAFATPSGNGAQPESDRRPRRYLLHSRRHGPVAHKCLLYTIRAGLAIPRRPESRIFTSCPSGFLPHEGRPWPAQ
jgi:hypothetical protein